MPDYDDRMLTPERDSRKGNGSRKDKKPKTKKRKRGKDNGEKA